MNWSNGAALAAVIALGLIAPSARAEDIDALIGNKFSGWTVYQHAEGDLNGDGKPDIAAILSKPAEAEDNGQALLVVYFDDGKGGYTLNTEAEKAICVGCGGPKAAFGEPVGELSISKGILHVDYQGGSRDAFDDDMKWRFDKATKQFLLIGETQHVTDTLGNEPEETLDINYLSLKTEKSAGKKKHSCAVPAEFKAVTLAAFDYDGKHADDLGKISEACDKR